MPNLPVTQPAQHTGHSRPPRKGHGAVPIGCTPDTQPTIFTRGNLTPGRWFKEYPIRVHPASIGIQLGKILHLAQPYGLRPKYPPAPPISLRQWPGPRERGPQFQSIRAFPHIPSRVVCTRLCGPSVILKPSPRSRVHRIIPLYTPKPHTCDQIPFCSRAPLGARSCSLVLPRPSLLCRRLNFYVPGEPAPHPRMDGVTNVQFYAGAIPGEAPLSMKRRPEMCSFDLDWFLRFRRGTPLPRKAMLGFPSHMGQTDVLQVFATGRVR